MKAELRNRVAKAMLSILFTIIIGAFSVWVSFASLDKLRSKNQNLIDDIMVLEQSIHALQEKGGLLAATMEAIRKSFLVGNIRSPKGINESREIAIRAANRYHIQNCHIHRAPWSMASDSTPRIKLFTAPLSISFEAFTDTEAVLFILSLINDLPGQLEATAFSLERTSDVTEDYIQSIAQGVKTKGQIKVMAQLKWYAALASQEEP